MSAKRQGTFFKRLLTAVVIGLLLAAFAGMTVSAVNDEGLTVEKLSFRDVLRLYTLDRDSFGAAALETDAGGVANASKRLADLFTYTVGLNYDGQGANSNYFGKDITALMGAEPYADSNLLATYDVEISPYRSYAVALPEGQTVSIRVYLTGYTNAANGVVPVLHYVWQDQGLWYAVKDDNPYYRVSYNGNSARQLSGTGLSITYTRSAAGGTESLQGWQDLTEAPDGNGVVHLDCSTLVVGQGTANVFGLTGDLSKLQTEGNYSASLLAVSDFVRGDATCQTGPLVYSRTVYETDNMHRVADGESLREGVSYHFRVVYDEPLAVAPEAGWSSVGMNIRSEITGASSPVSDFTWFGGEAYLTTNQYNPHAVEFTFTPTTQGYGVCTFVPQNLVGSESALKAAEFHARTETGQAPTPAPTSTPAPTAPPTQTPVDVPTAVPTQAPTQLPTQEPVVTPVTVATPVPATPVAEPVTPEPVPATPAAPMTPPATLDILFSANESSALTRGVLAETLWILAGQPAGDSSLSFTDSISDPNMSQAILWAGRTGLISATSGTFGVNEPVTREQAAAVLYRYAALRGKDVSVQSDLSAWADGSSVSAENNAGVVWALERGVMNGFGDGYLRPGQAATCGEAIEMIRTLQQKL